MRFHQSCNFIKKETLALVFSCKFCEISKNTFFKERLWTTASGDHQNKKINLCMLNSFKGFHLSIYFFNRKITSYTLSGNAPDKYDKIIVFFFSQWSHCSMLSLVICGGFNCRRLSYSKIFWFFLVLRGK